jgi:hypothetical protein
MKLLTLHPSANPYEPTVWKVDGLAICELQGMITWSYDMGLYTAISKEIFEDKDTALNDFFECFPKCRGKYAFKKGDQAGSG